MKVLFQKANSIFLTIIIFEGLQNDFQTDVASSNCICKAASFGNFLHCMVALLSSQTCLLRSKLFFIFFFKQVQAGAEMVKKKLRIREVKKLTCEINKNDNIVKSLGEI